MFTKRAAIEMNLVYIVWETVSFPGFVIWQRSANQCKTLWVMDPDASPAPFAEKFSLGRCSKLNPSSPRLKVGSLKVSLELVNLNGGSTQISKKPKVSPIRPEFGLFADKPGAPYDKPVAGPH